MPKAYKKCISNKFRWTCIFCDDSQQLVCALPHDETDLMCPDVEVNASLPTFGKIILFDS